MSARAFVVGAAMTPFVTPGYEPWDYPEMACLAGRMALKDAGISYEAVQEAFAGYCYGDSLYGQRALSGLGLTGIPITIVHNMCATGSAALRLGRRSVLAGVADCVLVVGFDRMPRGQVKGYWHDRASPLEDHLTTIHRGHPQQDAPPGVLMGAAAGADHMSRYGSRPEHFAWVAWKNYQHATANPDAQFRQGYTTEEITSSRMILPPLTRLQCSRASVGAAAAVVASRRFVEEHGLTGSAVEIWGQAMVSDTPETFPQDGNGIDVLGYPSARTAALRVFEQTGVGPADVQVIELHDAFSTAELIAYEALGLAPRGEGHLLVERGETTYGGRWVVNPSGGLIARGNPSGATGVAQCAELVWQLRGTAGDRQVADARVALQHNISPGAAVVTLYRRPGWRRRRGGPRVSRARAAGESPVSRFPAVVSSAAAETTAAVRNADARGAL